MPKLWVGDTQTMKNRCSEAKSKLEADKLQVSHNAMKDLMLKYQEAVKGANVGY